jgi:hypothetical protein
LIIQSSVAIEISTRGEKIHGYCFGSTVRKVSILEDCRWSAAVVFDLLALAKNGDSGYSG